MCLLWHTYARGLFNLSDQNVLEFLKTYLPTTWGLESGLSRKGDFERSQYNAVTKLVDPNIIVRKLVEKYGDNIKNAKSTFEYMDKSLDEKVAYQFVAMYNHVKSENQAQEKDLKEDPSGETTQDE
jgi:hypothetical protein